VSYTKNSGEYTPWFKEVTVVERHPSITCISPDAIAECWDGILGVPGLYEALWSFTDKYTDPRPEVSEEPIYGGGNDISNFWDQLSEKHQEALNRLVTEQFWFCLEPVEEIPSADELAWSQR
jgi:hypothetical protein